MLSMNLDATTIRKLNLRYLVDKNGIDGLAAMIDREPAYIRQLVGPRRGTSGAFGPSIARHIERQMKIEHGWLDVPHESLWSNTVEEFDGVHRQVTKDEESNAQHVTAGGLPPTVDTEQNIDDGDDKDANELRLIFLSLPKSGRYALMAKAYEELEKIREKSHADRKQHW